MPRNNRGMLTNPRKQQRYDHRLRELVQSTGDIDLAVQRGVPRSTAHGWLARNSADVVTLDVLDMNVSQLQQELVSLRRRNERLISLLRLVVTVLKVAGFSLSRIRLPEESTKRQLLRAIELPVFVSLGTGEPEDIEERITTIRPHATLVDSAKFT
jgi:hypothetical protein